MPLDFSPATGAAILIGVIIGLNIGFAFGTWWNAMRTAQRDDQP